MVYLVQSDRANSGELFPVDTIRLPFLIKIPALRYSFQDNPL